MTRRSRFPRDDKAAYRALVVEKVLMQRHYPVFGSRIAGSVLVCTGRIRPADHCAAYDVEVRYRYGHSPRVRVWKPTIDYDPRIHMYEDGSLCVYDWREDPWLNEHHLYDRLIPWVAEWLVYYEVFRLTGKWLGKEAPHTAGKAPDPAAQSHPGLLGRPYSPRLDLRRQPLPSRGVP